MRRFQAVSILAAVTLSAAVLLLTVWSIHLADQRAEVSRALVTRRASEVEAQNRRLIRAVAEYLVCVYEMQYGPAPSARPVDECGPILEEVLDS